VKMIDCAPTWSGVVPVILAGIENGTAKGREIAVGELQRMAKLADAYVASQKAAEVANEALLAYSPGAAL
jgi:hypothetical protein